MKRYVYLNGKYVVESKAKIDIDDIGLLRGYGVFDNLRTFNGKPFLLDKHLSSLSSSAKQIGLYLPYSKPKISRIINKLLKVNRNQESVIKIVVTGGASKDGVSQSRIPTFFITAKPLKFKRDLVKKGVKLITFEHQRSLPQIKTFNYLNIISMHNKLKKENAYTVLYINKGVVREGAKSNIFMVHKDKIYTPKENILKGITRDLIIKLARKNKYQLVEGEIKLQQLLNSNEVFITGTTYGIIPVVQIDNEKINKGRVGPVTLKLISIYSNYVNQFFSPHG